MDWRRVTARHLESRRCERQRNNPDRTPYRVDMLRWRSQRRTTLATQDLRNYLNPGLIPKLKGNSSAIAVPKFLVTRSNRFCLWV